jgi:hypothetical protein
MGSNQSSTIENTIDIYNQNTFSEVQKLTNSANANCEAKQDINITILPGTHLDCGDGGLNVSQVATCTADLSSSFTQDNKTQLKTVMQNALEQTANSSQKAVADFLSTSFSNSNVNQKLSQHISNVIDTHIENIANNTCAASAKIVQNQTVNIGGAGTYIKAGSCNFGQNAQASAIASCLTNSMLSTISDNTTLTQSIQDAASKQDSSQTGLGSLLSSLFNAYTLIVLAFVIGVVVVIVMVIRMFHSSAPLQQAASDNISNYSAQFQQQRPPQAGGMMFGAPQHFSQPYSAMAQ